MSTLKIDVDSSSYFLGQRTRFEVRNADLQLIKTVAGGYETLDLDPGLYHISAILQDGQQHERLIEIASEPVEVRFSLDADDVTLKAPAPATTKSLYKAPFASLPDMPAAGAAGPGAPDTVILEHITGGTAQQVAPLQWIIEPEGEPQVPVAFFATRDDATGESDAWAINLPVNPRANFPLNACTVVFEQRDSRLHPDCWIAPERTVSNTLQHWLVNGRVAQSLDIAEEATELLASKYQDPVGAVLGAIILRRLGRLAERHHWVDNLARDFAWLADGRILRLTLEAAGAGPSRELVQQARDLAADTVLFSESYSILINLLRRWPGAADDNDETFEEERQAALRALADQTVSVDWSSVVLTRRADSVDELMAQTTGGTHAQN